MRKFAAFCMITIVVFTTIIFANVKNSDKPLKGEWNFDLKKVWSVEKAGEKLLARPGHVMSSDDGTVYLYDYQCREYFIFSSSGKFLKGFATKGEGPGEIKSFIASLFVKDKVAIVEDQTIDYYDKNGTYIKKVQNSFASRAPWHFLNDDEFISYPLVNPNDEKMKTGGISLVNLKTNQKKVFATFPNFRGGFALNGNVGIQMIIYGLTPMVISGYDSNKFYYGLNEKYEIYALDYKGKKLNTFSIEGRTKTKMSKEDKLNYVKGYNLPENVLNVAIKGIPDDILYFTRIDVINGLIYVHNATVADEIQKQAIDIFSPEGKYLYCAYITAPSGFSIVSRPIPVLSINKNHFLYMVLQNDEGDVFLTKFEISLPKS